MIDTNVTIINLETAAYQMAIPDANRTIRQKVHLGKSPIEMRRKATT